MTEVLFDMETGDPDDLITLLMLLSNPDVDLKAVTCWQGSAIQIGLIKHVLELAGLESTVLVGGENKQEPQELSPYYTRVVGKWKPQTAQYNATEVFAKVLKQYPDVNILTGAPLTNVAEFLNNNKDDLLIKRVVTQGGFLGSIVENPLRKFEGVNAIRSYNLSSDTSAFDVVNDSKNITDLTFVTKDFCHGFMYTSQIHKEIYFGQSPVQKLLQKCLADYALSNRSKAMHDPLAMLYLLYPEVGQRTAIEMSYFVDGKGHALFSSKINGLSLISNNNRFGVIDIDKETAWLKFRDICQSDFVAIPSNRANSLKKQK